MVPLMPYVTVDRSSSEPLTRQIYARLRDLILSGSLVAGTKMSSTRDIAAELGVSRNVVMNAFDQLHAEGYLDTRAGSGSFVATGAALSPAPQPDLSRVRPRGFRPLRADRIDFRSGLPDLSRFPVRTWQRLCREVWDALTPRDLSYGQPEGRPELRAEICRYVAAARGVRCHPDQIVITAGTTQAVGIVSRLLVSGTRTACVLEDPITSDIQRIVQANEARVLPVPVDERGMIVDALPRTGHAFVYVTPSHQFPLGATMPIQRRAALIRHARRSRVSIVEDDYDSEFRYDAPPVGSIQELDPERVVYIGTFSKTLCPAVRIGYIVLPPELVNRGREVKWFTDLHNSSVDQLILARFMADGHFARYVHAMRKIYRARRDATVKALQRHFGARAEVLGSPAGIHLCARFRGVRFTAAVMRRAEAKGIVLYPVEEHAIVKGRFTDTLIFGYGMLDASRIDKGLAILRRCLYSS